MEYKYLYETEDQCIFKSKNPPTEDEKQNADDGYLSIYNVEDMTVYIDGKWEPIAIWGENV